MLCVSGFFYGLIFAASLVRLSLSHETRNEINSCMFLFVRPAFNR